MNGQPSAPALAINEAAPGSATLASVPLLPADFAAIAAIMQSDARIALSDAKMTLVQSRLAKRLRQHGLSQYRDYIEMVRSNATERAAMVVALTTNHTHFFRENHHFDHFRDYVIPDLKRRAAAGHPVRIWSAGCSSGEEVYTIAMCLLGDSKASAAWLQSANVRLLATDLSPLVVEATQRAVYSAQSAEPVPDAYRRNWMKPTDGGFTMAHEARSLVTAKVLNLFEPWPLRHEYDVIFCRNVMIYFDDDAKAELETRLVDQLAPGGHFYIGHSERLIGPVADRMTCCGQTIYVRRDQRS